MTRTIWILIGDKMPQIKAYVVLNKLLDEKSKNFKTKVLNIFIDLDKKMNSIQMIRGETKNKLFFINLLKNYYKKRLRELCENESVEILSFSLNLLKAKTANYETVLIHRRRKIESKRKKQNE